VSNPQRKRGAVPGDLVRIDTNITPELDSGLDELVLVTGQSKASLIRQALAQFLASRGVLPPNHPQQIEPTPTRGPRVTTRKDKS
jgi:hypothetical protein